MSKITFDQLLHVYRNIDFNSDGSSGRLKITDNSIIETLDLIEANDRVFEDAGVAIKGSPEGIVLGAKIDVEVSPPRTGLGLLVKNIDELLGAQANRVREPQKYYIISERFAYNDSSVPDVVGRYRTVLRLVRALSEAAALVDEYKAEAIFLNAGRVRMPILFEASDLHQVSSKTVEDLETFVLEKMHKDQKTAILATNVVELCRHQPEHRRFKFLLAHLGELLSKTQDGYRLFASEFSYEKIKGKTEEAINDYTSKIHKTFHDIQNQAMGVPVATVIVATQLKAATDCGVEFWANLAIALGATLFVLLLSAAIYNQLLTLSSIKGDLKRQEDKLKAEYATVAGKFLPLYAKLERRVKINVCILWAIVFVCSLGVVFTWFLFIQLTVPSIASCLNN